MRKRDGLLVVVLLVCALMGLEAAGRSSTKKTRASLVVLAFSLVRSLARLLARYHFFCVGARVFCG
jgi:hypothetical protein